jgi:hypothetical protein
MSFALVCIGALIPAAAWAQMPVVDPSGRTPPDQGPPAAPGSSTGIPGGIYGIDRPPPAPATPEIRVVLPPGGQVEQEGKDGKSKELEGLWIATHKGAAPKQPQQTLVPETYVVQKGDTLWDICTTFFADPYLWPRIWAQNPTITNPHWIYPGDIIKLREPGAPAPTAAVTPPPRPRDVVRLRRLAYMSVLDLASSSEIVGSTEERLMLASGDEIYLTYPDGKPPQVGETYAIYSPTKDVFHPVTGERVGAYVQVLGELRVLDVKKGKNAHAKITDVTDEGVVERGNRVGPLKTQFQMVAPVPAEKTVEGVIVAILHVDQLIGEGNVVVIDRGRRDGLVIGNNMLAVRRGDAYLTEYGSLGAGQDDRRYPDNYLANIIILDVADAHAMGVLSKSDKEILIGDHVLMRAVSK